MTPEIKERIAQLQRGEVPGGYSNKKSHIIPTQWKLLKIKDIANVSSGATPKREVPEYWNGDIPWVTTGELEIGTITETHEYITSRGLSESHLRLYPADTLLMAMYGQGKTRGTVAMLKQEAAINQACAAIQVINGSPRFLFYFLQNSYDAIRRLSNIGNQENLNAELIRGFPIFCPSNTEQQCIATILTTQDRLIGLKERLLEEKKQQKKYLMQQILTGKKRLPGFNGDWKMVRLNQVLTERIDKNQEQKLRICSVAVREGVVDQIEHLGRSFAAKDTSNYGVAYNGDVIYTKSPTGDFPFGIIKQSHLSETVAVSPLYGVYKPVSYGLGYILHTYFSEPINAKNYLLPIVQKGAKNTINITNKTFISNSLYLPMDVSEQNAIAEIFMTTDREIELIGQTLEQEKQKKKALMQLLLTGIVRIKI